MKKLTLNDYKTVKYYLDLAQYDGYNSNFVNMMLWDHEYNIFYHQEEHFLVMLHTYGNERFFSMPFCKSKYIDDAIEYMKNYANKNHFPFKIEVATEDFINKLKTNHSELLCIEDRNNFDYVYLKENLMTLKGKKMQKRRNHLNAFKKSNIDYIYKEIEDHDIDAVLKCLRKWDDSKDNEESIQSEYIAIMYALIHRHELHLKTGCIYINNEIEAFAIGSELYHQTIEIHFEKANKNIRGLYVLIGQLFLQNNYPDALYVNREEDMGLESLRKSKMDLHPDHMVKKYTIIEKNLRIRKAEDSDFNLLQSNWLNTFEDEDQLSTQFYFSHLYKKENTYLLQNNEKIIGCMQIRPFTISEHDKIKSVYFILGVIVKKAFRHNGCMNTMIRYVLDNDFKNKQVMLQAYIPEIYHHLGFKDTYINIHYRADKVIDNEELKDIIFIDDVDIKEKEENLLMLYKRHCKQYDGYYVRDNNYYRNYFIPRLESLNRNLKFIKVDNELIGYIEYEINRNELIITEFIYTEKKYIVPIINFLLEKYKVVQFDLPESIDVEWNSKPYCQMLANFSLKTKSPLYINEIY